MTATGSTRGGERGYDAFIGDPFGIDVTGGRVITTQPVPEPQVWLLLVAGPGTLGRGAAAEGEISCATLRVARADHEEALA